MKPKKIPLPLFKSIYSKVPRLCVDLVIPTPQGILLTKRDLPPDKGWWHFPGGTVLLGETLADTAHRVALEELHTPIEIKKSLGFLEYTQGSGLGYPISAVFLVKSLRKPEGSEHAKNIDFFKKLPSKTLPEVKSFLKKNFQLD